MSITGSTIYSDVFKTVYDLLDGNTSASAIRTAFPIGSVTYPLVVVNDAAIDTTQLTMHPEHDMSNVDVLIDVYDVAKSGVDIVSGQVRQEIMDNRVVLQKSGLSFNELNTTSSNTTDLSGEKRIHVKTLSLATIHGD